MPDVKRCLYMVTQAWARVSEDTVVNCWKKCDIINDVIDKEVNQFMSYFLSNFIVLLAFFMSLFLLCHLFVAMLS